MMMKTKSNNQMKTSNLLEKLPKKNQLESHSIVSIFIEFSKFEIKIHPYRSLQRNLTPKIKEIKNY